MPGPGLDLLGAEELAGVSEVLASGHLSRYGPDDASFPAKVRTFEEEVARRAGVGHALALNSGTSGLMLALMALGVGPGDEVIVPGFTFVATISAVVYARARPVLAEVDDTFNLDPADVEARITPRTRAIILVHMLGNPGRLPELKALADRHGIALIEDCAQAFGATYDNRWVGSYGAAGIYSFNEFKTITCGDGGLLVTDDEGLYRRAFALHDQGHSPNRKGIEVGARPFLGLNFRMTELEGAVLLAQLGKLDLIRDHLAANRNLVEEIIGEVPRIEFRTRPDPGGDLGSHLVVIFPDAASAEAVTSELGSITLAASGWHVYSQMEHVLTGRTISGRGCPFDCSCTDGRPPDYQRGMLPRTDALLARSMSFAIGVMDPNLAPFGLRMRDDADVARRQAERFRSVALRHLA
ncbi:MAG TPA: DegT/DnrJ/EryC1/StrS family aminotransferase [Candidatus Limnocylindrales bacterium]|nr:DegT/DnrJ/EryC1/StrS family aminotransferase [Candidatus Limnocylindrales bacterium]